MIKLCGICGIAGFEDKKLIRRMCHTIVHRGPDSGGFFFDKDVGLGMRRLKIIDLKNGDQPIFNEDETVCVVYNGEIYNYLEIRQELEKKGHRFYTNCDTEVLVHLYEEYGAAFPKKLNGMFAFAIWDLKHKKLLLGRDRLGKKPLYYLLHDGKIIFGSEIKCILEYDGYERSVDMLSLHNYLTLQFVPAPNTMFKDIKKLKQGHVLVFRKKRAKISKYWELPKFVPEKNSEEYFASKLLELLRDSVKMRMMSEVPLGVFLSGGLDSSAVVALMSEFSEEPVKTFSVGFDVNNTSELKYAKITSDYFNTDHHEINCKMNAVKLLPDVVWHADEPLADAAMLPTYQMSEVTKKYVTVVLTGEGGDEVFAGYGEYEHLLYGNMYHKIIPKGLVKSTKHLTKFVPQRGNARKYLEFAQDLLPLLGDKKESYYMSTSIFKDEEKENLLVEKNNFPKTRLNFNLRNNFLNEMLKHNINVNLADGLLMKVDKMTMAHSIEARVPLLDFRLVEFSTKIPPSLKLKGSQEKYILKKLMKDILPKEIVKRKKHGFNVPLSHWFRGELKELAQQMLSESKVEKYFNRGFVKHLLDNPQNLKYDRKLWLLLNFHVWHKIFIEGEKVGRIL